MHKTRLRSHNEQHTCVVAVYPRVHSPLSPVPPSPVSPSPSSPLSRSPTPSPARDPVVEQDGGEIKELVFDHDDSDADSQATTPVDFQDFPHSPASVSSVPVGTLLPENYQSWPRHGKLRPSGHKHVVKYSPNYAMRTSNMA